MICIFCTSI